MSCLLLMVVMMTVGWWCCSEWSRIQWFRIWHWWRLVINPVLSTFLLLASYGDGCWNSAVIHDWSQRRAYYWLRYHKNDCFVLAYLDTTSTKVILFCDVIGYELVLHGTLCCSCHLQIFHPNPFLQPLLPSQPYARKFLPISALCLQVFYLSQFRDMWQTNVTITQDE